MDMKKGYFILIFSLVLLATFPLASGSIRTIVNTPSGQNIVDSAVLIPEVDLKVGMTNYDPVNKYALFAIIKDGNVTDYLTRDNVEVGADLDLITSCYTVVQKVGENSVEIAFACTGKPQFILVANSIDYSLASGFITYLDNLGVTVIHATAEQFNDPRYDYKHYQNIIILGGPDAPEGIGEISGKYLNSDEIKFIRENGNRGMFPKGDMWAYPQSVTIIAGSDRDQTKLAQEENRDRFIVK